jgi:ketosteroid isomerase-like protein
MWMSGIVKYLRRSSGSIRRNALMRREVHIIFVGFWQAGGRSLPADPAPPRNGRGSWGMICCMNDPAGTLQEKIEEVTQANQQFYEAFESLDVAHMDRIWLQQDYVTCIHPGWTQRVGWPAVRDSWVLIFNNTFSMKFELTEIQIQVAGDVAWVICTENITSRQGEATRESQVLATNLYERVGKAWKIIHHHGSPVVE